MEKIAGRTVRYALTSGIKLTAAMRNRLLISRRNKFCSCDADRDECVNGRVTRSTSTLQNSGFCPPSLFFDLPPNSASERAIQSHEETLRDLLLPGYRVNSRLTAATGIAANQKRDAYAM
ncbi:hypothetical protein Tcan_04216 [Toxocara canis]|uniref:Uncharacterized protein n=1 Tax=Toxocara canis TaxID=6265 RepID=A0A0B2UUW2_TOXCA|nr:hypothetical protein Tcan_04216 [Toxocara canis]